MTPLLARETVASEWRVRKRKGRLTAERKKSYMGREVDRVLRGKGLKDISGHDSKGTPFF